ncbi:hypothetical protein GPALN_005543 [Globodera pallida]|nr:hypothetical protein GPALN_005543 [Globodera pallida]
MPTHFFTSTSLSPPTLVSHYTLSSSTTSTAPVVEEKRKAPPLLPLPNRWIYKQWKVESIAQTTTLSSSDVGGGNRSSNSEQFPTDPSQRRKKAAKVVVNKRRVVEKFLLVGGGGDVKEVAAGTVTLPEGAGGVEIVDDRRSDSNRMVAACVAASSATVTTAAAAYLNHNQTGLTGGLGGGGGCKKDMATSFNPSTASKGVSMATAEVEQLRQQLQTVVENGDLSASNACAGQLENAVLSKETLEATRIGRFVNDIRKQTAQQWPDFSKRCRALIKQWQKVAEYRPSSSCEGSSNGGTPQLVSPALKRGLTPRSGAVTTPGKRATPQQQQQQRVTSTGLCPPDARQNTGRSSSALSSSASVSPVENGVAASSGSYAPLPQTGKKMSPKQNVAAVQQPSMHKSASVGATMNRLDASSTMRQAVTMLNGIAEVGAVAGGARLASGPSYANIAMEFGAAKPPPMSLTAPSMLLTNNPPLTLKLKRSASGVQRLTSSMSPPPDNAMASASTSAATVAQQSHQLQQQQSVHAARKNVQSTAQLVAQLSKALPQHIGIDLNNKQQHQQMGPGQNVVTKKISSDPIRTNVSTASENTKRRHHKRKDGRASEERTEATFVKQMKMTDTGEVKEDEKLQGAKRGQGVEKAGTYEKKGEGKTEAMREQLRQADEIDKEGRKGRKKKKEKQHQNDTTGTKFNWFAEFPLSTAASTSTSVEQHAGEGAGPTEGILANVYASPTRSFVVPAYERQLLLLPYMDIGLPDWRVHNFPQSDRFLFPEPNEWHKKPS